MEQQRHYVGIDLHRRRSVIVHRSAEGETLGTVCIDNDPIALAADRGWCGNHRLRSARPGRGPRWRRAGATHAASGQPRATPPTR